MINDFWLGMWAGVTAWFVILVIVVAVAAARKGK